MEVKIMGHVLGEASGWDEIIENLIQFYDFKPTKEAALDFNLAECDTISFDTEEGWVQMFISQEGRPQRIDFGLRLK